jgi:hypothetical protein
MDHDEFEKLTYDYLEDKIDKDKRFAFDTHMAECEECRKSFYMQTKIEKALFQMAHKGKELFTKEELDKIRNEATLGKDAKYYLSEVQLTLFIDGKKVRKISGVDRFKVPVSKSGKYEILDSAGDLVCKKEINLPEKVEGSFEDFIVSDDYEMREAAKRKFVSLEDEVEYQGKKITFEFVIEQNEKP